MARRAERRALPAWQSQDRQPLRRITPSAPAETHRSASSGRKVVLVEAGIHLSAHNRGLDLDIRGIGGHEVPELRHVAELFVDGALLDL
jgi:hypothetical protein